MAREVRAKIDTKVVAHKDLEITVRETAGKLGTLLVSKGNIEWLPARASKTKKRLTWSRFAKLMESEGRTVRRKPW